IWKAHQPSRPRKFIGLTIFTRRRDELPCWSRRDGATVGSDATRSFFLAQSDPAVLLSCQIFLHAQQIALAGTLNNPQQLSHRGDLLQLLLNEPLKEIVGRIIGLSLCHGQKRIDLGCDLLFLCSSESFTASSATSKCACGADTAGIFTRAPVSMTNWIKRSACSFSSSSCL